MTGTKHLITTAVVIAWAGIAMAQEPNQDVLHKLSQIKQPQAVFHIRLATNRKAYQPGDPVEFTFSADRDCYLTLIDVATEGVIRVIFPNKYSRNNFVQAGKTYNIPGDYGFNMKISGPSGVERVKAIATTAPMSVFEMDFAQGDYFFFEGKPDNEVITRGIGGLTSQLDKHTWTETELEFEIKETAISDKARGCGEETGKPAPKPMPGTGTQEHVR